MFKHKSRLPRRNVEGFKGRYEAFDGDEIKQIAKHFKVKYEELLHANPHIENPEEVFKGDVLCVPALTILPRCIILKSQEKQGINCFVAVHLGFSSNYGEGMRIMAELEEPSRWGSFDSYIVKIHLPECEICEKFVSISTMKGNYFCRVDFLEAIELNEDTRISVHPYNNASGVEGVCIFDGSLREELNNFVAKDLSFRNNLIYLKATGIVKDASGYFEIRRDRKRLTVLAIGLPEPDTFDKSCKTYRAYAVEIESQSRYRIDLKRSLKDNWIGQTEYMPLMEFNEVMVVAEPWSGRNGSNGPVVLIGDLR